MKLLFSVFFIYSSIFLPLITAASASSSSSSLPLLQLHLAPCELGQDADGSWWPVDNLQNIDEFERKHLFASDPLPSLASKWPLYWLTNNCSYVRFTKKSIVEAANLMLDRENNKRTVNTISNGINKDKDNVFRVSVFADSATRGIICGIGRLAFPEGEFYGPSKSQICGGVPQQPSPPSFESEGQYKTAVFGDDINNKLVFNFMYTKSLVAPRFALAQQIIDSMKQAIISADDPLLRPHVLILNTGAWDFLHLSAKNYRRAYHDECEDMATTEVSKERSNAAINASLWELSELGERYGVRLIYRNNHFNKRFGVYCADRHIERMLRGSHWDVWDNRQMSREVYVTQTDGFHFDRGWLNERYEHEEYYKDKGSFVYGYLEQQLAHSLLNFIFHPVLELLTTTTTTTADADAN